MNSMLRSIQNGNNCLRYADMANLIISGDAGSGRVAEVTALGTSMLDRVSKGWLDDAAKTNALQICVKSYEQTFSGTLLVPHKTCVIRSVADESHALTS
jgi:hypothetical protein